MTDVARLRYEIDSSQAKTAEKNLGGMSSAAKKATSTQKELSGSTGRLSTTIKNANDNIAKSNGMLGGSFTKMKGVAVGAFLAMAAAATLFVKSLAGRFIDATVESDRGQAQLAAAIRSTGGAARQTVEDLNAHAAALQKVTIFGDEYINKAQGLLLTFTKIQGDVFPRATAAILDMATAMKVDLQSATLSVGKALNDPVRGMTALSRSGIQFTQAQQDLVKQMVATNNVVGAQTLILEELERQFGGSAVAARNTLGGAIAALGNSFGDLFEITGAGSAYMRVAIERLVRAISDPAFVAFANLIGNVLLGAVGLLSDALAGLVTVFNWVSRAAAGVWEILTRGLFASLGAVDEYREGSRNIWSAVVADIKTATNFIVGSAVGAYDTIRILWSSFPDVMGDVAYSAANLFIDGINFMVSKATAGIDKIIEKVNLIPGVNIASFGSVEAIGRIDNPFAGAASRASGQISDAFSSALSTDWVGVETEIQGAAVAASEFSEASQKAGGASKQAAEKAKDAWGKLRTATSDYLKEVKSATNELGSSLGGVFRKLIDGTTDWKEIALQAIASVITYLNKMNIAGGGSGIFGGGFFQSLIGGFLGLNFGGARASGGGMMPGKFYRVNEEGQEFAMNARATKQFRPQLEAMNAGRAPVSDRPDVYSPTINISAPNSDKAAIQNLEAVVTKQIKDQYRTHLTMKKRAELRKVRA